MATATSERGGQGLTELYAPKGEATIDIIAVPGLAARPQTSFDSFKKIGEKAAFNWLSDDEGLQTDFDTARVFLYEYNSRWKSKDAVDESIYNISTNLLESLVMQRENTKSRPIVFIGHSMGGIVVAKALYIASTRGDEYPSIYQCCAGCLLFGAPFGGSPSTKKALFLATILEKTDDAVKSRLLTFLEPGNSQMEELRTDFVRIANKLDPKLELCCFYERRPTDFAKAKLGFSIPGQYTRELMVPQESATLDGVDSVGMNCDHRELNRFDTPKDGRYEVVRSRLKRMVKQANSAVKHRLNKSRATLMDDTTFANLLAQLQVGDVNRKRTAIAQLSGSNSWTLLDDKYKTWSIFDAENPKKEGLLISGQEGRGKSKASITVINDLLDREQKGSKVADTSIAVAYFFCGSTPEYASAESILRSLIWQLISKRRSLALYARDFIPNEKGIGRAAISYSDTIFTVQNLWRTLQEMIADPSIECAYFVINSLHELPEDLDSTREFLKLVNELIQETLPDNDALEPKGNPQRWMFLSRQRSNIRDAFTNNLNVQVIDMDDEKYGGALRRDYKDYARRRVAELAKKKGYTPALKYFASSLVERKAENMVWVDVVCRKLELLPASHVEVRTTLERLPQSLPALLDQEWSAVLRSNDNDVEWTKEILRSLLLAYQDPTTEELDMLTEIVYSGVERESKGKLVSAINRCGPLVQIIDREDVIEYRQDPGDFDDADYAGCRVTFIHGNARNRLQERAKELLGFGEEEKQWQHGVLALRCFANVINNLKPPEDLREDSELEVNQLRSNDNGKVDVLQQEQELMYQGVLDYALSNWLRHANDASGDVVDSLLDESFWSLSSEIRSRWWQKLTDYDESLQGLEGLTALHVAAFYGITSLVRALLELGHKNEIHIRDSLENQPLHWAAEKGHNDIVQILLDKGADINDGIKERFWTPLHMAASAGQTKVMVQLLDRQDGPHAEINAIASGEGTPLTLAIARGQANAARLALKYGADPTLTADDAEPPLSLAAMSNDVNILEMALQAGAGNNIKSVAHGSALASAATSMNVEIVKRVMEVDKSIESRQRALETAADLASEGVVELVLRTSAGLKCDEAFTSAASRGADRILEMLWQYSGGNIAQSSLNKSLYTATDFEFESTVNHLLEMQADPNSEGEEYENALTAAANDGTVNIVKSLLAAGAKASSSVGYALQAAASGGHNEIINLLLQHGADVNAISEKFDPGTALQAACVSGFDETVELLLGHGANPKLGRGTHTCPIIAAAHGKEAKILEMLVNAGADVNVNGGPWNTTTLIYGAITLPVSSVQLLVEKGKAKLDAIDADGDTAVICAATQSDTETVEMLIDHGANFKYTGGENGTALHAAAHAGAAECCRRLLARGADPTIVAGKFGSVIQAAASSGNAETIEVVLNTNPNVDVNTKGGLHGTPLHAAAIQADSRCVELLLDHGAEIDAPGGEHGTSMQTAAFAGCNRNVLTLLNRKADPNASGGKHGNVLQAAALKCQTSVVQALLSAGAKIDSPKLGKYGSALAAAASRNETGVLDLLMREDFPTEAFQEAMACAAKYNKKVSFQMLSKSRGAKTLPRAVRYGFWKQLNANNDRSEGDTNSDFGDDAVWNFQDADSLDYEDEEYDEEFEMENNQEQLERSSEGDGPSVGKSRSALATFERQPNDQIPAHSTSGLASRGDARSDSWMEKLSISGLSKRLTAGYQKKFAADNSEHELVYHDDHPSQRYEQDSEDVQGSGNGETWEYQDNGGGEGHDSQLVSPIDVGEEGDIYEEQSAEEQENSQEIEEDEEELTIQEREDESGHFEQNAENDNEQDIQVSEDDEDQVSQEDEDNEDEQAQWDGNDDDEQGLESEYNSEEEEEE